MAVCNFCGNPFPEGKIFRTTLCSKCGRELKICLNCDFYAPGVHWDCRETIPEAVREKDRANFCDYFRPRSGGGKAAENRGTEGSRAGFEKLFGDG